MVKIYHQLAMVEQYPGGIKNVTLARVKQKIDKAPQRRFIIQELAEETGEALLYGQLKSRGWPHGINFACQFQIITFTLNS